VKQLFSILLGVYRGTSRHSNWVVVCLDGAWPKLVGDKLASVCRPVRLNDTELVVEILDRDWENALKSVQSNLQQKLESATMGFVKTLSFSSQLPVASRQ
jgi:hypothetical protein